MYSTFMQRYCIQSVTCRLEQPEIEPPTFKLVDDLLYLMSQSNAQNNKE